MVRSTPLTVRSQLLRQLLPALRAGIRKARLPSDQADEALQQSLVALLPHLDTLTAKTESDRAAYAFIVGSRTALHLRKRTGMHSQRATDEEVARWERESARRSVDPEQALRAAQGAEKAERAFSGLNSRDQRLVAAVNDDGLSERDVAREFGMSRNNVVYHLKLARDELARAWLGTTSWVARKRRNR